MSPFCGRAAGHSVAFLASRAYTFLCTSPSGYLPSSCICRQALNDLVITCSSSREREAQSLGGGWHDGALRECKRSPRRGAGELLCPAQDFLPRFQDSQVAEGIPEMTLPPVAFCNSSGNKRALGGMRHLDTCIFKVFCPL